MHTCLTAAALAADLAVRDLTDPAQGRHAIQLIVEAVVAAAVARRPGARLVVHRGERIVDIEDNYDNLGYAAAAAARDGRYARYVDATRMLRSQTSALIPGALRRLKADSPETPRQPEASSQETLRQQGDGGREVLLACPGVVYRRDCIDRLHTGTPHQLDLWTVGGGGTEDQLHDLVATAVAAALPGVPWRTTPADHPYTTGGLEIEARAGDRWVEIGECGIAADQVVPGGDGLALGLGLDRLLMLRKGVDDIRLLRSADPRVARQMTDLTPYRPVSAQPPARRDLSVALPPDLTDEDLGDRVRTLLGADAHLVEEVAILSRTAPEELPAESRRRLAIRDGEVNVLLRVILRDLHRTLPRQKANEIRDRLLAGIGR
jgi:phenylalanyl-tRNA synthetase alpha chain